MTVSPSMWSKSGWVASVQWKVAGDGDGCDHGIEATCGRLAAGATLRYGHKTKSPCRCRVEGERFEICLCLLKVGLALGSFFIGRGDERADG